MHHFVVYGAAQLQTSQGAHAVRVPLSTIKSINNEHVSIRTGPQSNARMCSGLLNHIFFYITWRAGCPFVAYLGNTCHQDTFIGKKASEGSVMFCEMFCREMLGPAILVDVTLTCTLYLSIAADHAHPFIETA